MLALLLLACAGPPALPGRPLPPGWVDAMEADPAAFDAAVGAHRDGWAALHRGDLWAATAAEGPPAARAAAELARVARALRPGLARVASTQKSDEARFFEALGAAGWGERPAAVALPAGHPLAAAAGALGSGGLEALGQLAGPIGACVAAHLAVRSGGALGDLAGACPDPLWVGAGGGHRDPLVLSTLAARPVPALPPEAALPFSAAWSAADVDAPLAGPSLRALGWTGDPDVDFPALDAALAARPAEAGPGAALVADLRLLSVWRAQVVAAAWEAAPRGHGARVLAWGVDAQDGRGPGPARPPLLLAAEAAEALAVGQPRAALDALFPLAEAVPVLAPVREAVADAAATESIGRDGLSFAP